MENKKITCHDVFGNKVEVGSDKLTFRPSVYGILIENNKILLSRQWDGYDFPGGGMEVDETIDECLKREFFEETGVKVDPVDIVHCESSFFHPSHSKKNKNKYWNCQLFFYLVKKIGGEVSKDNLDSEELGYADMPEWIGVDDVGDLKFINSVNSPSIIKKALKYKKNNL